MGHAPAYGTDRGSKQYELRRVGRDEAAGVEQFDLDIHLDTFWDNDPDGGLSKHAVRDIVIPLNVALDPRDVGARADEVLGAVYIAERREHGLRRGLCAAGHARGHRVAEAAEDRGHRLVGGDVEDDPFAAIDALLAAYPQIAELVVSPMDEAWFTTLVREYPKPMPFVPAISRRTGRPPRLRARRTSA